MSASLVMMEWREWMISVPAFLRFLWSHITQDSLANERPASTGLAENLIIVQAIKSRISICAKAILVWASAESLKIEFVEALFF